MARLALRAILVPLWVLIVPLLVTGDLLPFLKTPRGTLYATLFLFWWSYEALYVRLGGGGLRADRLTRAALAMSWLAGAYASIADFAPRLSSAAWDLWASLGIISFLLGFAIRHFSIHTLGPYFSDALQVRPAQPIIRRGLYAYLRHPSYSGLALIGLSIPLLFGSFKGGLILGAIAAPALSYRIALEERLLVEAYKDEYREYMRRTKRLIPFVF